MRACRLHPPDALTKKIGIEAVVECLHKSMMVYIDLNNNKMNPPATSGEFLLSLSFSVCVSVCVVELRPSFSLSCLCRWYVTLPAVAAGPVATSSGNGTPVQVGPLTLLRLVFTLFGVLVPRI
jgi:hypothetical protein